MPDEIALHKAAARAQQAKALLEDPLLKEAFTTLERSYIDEWRSTDPADMDRRERLFLAVNQVERVKSNLAAVISDGTLAAKELERLYAEQDRKKKLGI